MSHPWRFERYQLASGLNMRIARCGPTDAPLVVMLHGFPECWYSYRHQMRALSDRFDCAAVEMRGYGETDAPRGVSNYSLDKLVGDVADIIHALGREKAVVIGHDWGGAVAWATALTRVEVVERLIVLNCPHPARFSRELARNPRQMLRSWYMLFFQIPWLPEAIMRRGNFATLLSGMRDMAVQKSAISDEDLEYFRAALKNPYAITAAINYYRAMFRSQLRPSSRRANSFDGKIAIPTMLIWGEDDFALGKELTYGMEPLFSGEFQLKYIADCGHWVQQEKPEQVNQHIAEFLAPLCRVIRAS